MSYREFGRALRQNNVQFIEEIGEEGSISGQDRDIFDSSEYTNVLLFALEELGEKIDSRIIECLLTRFPFSLFNKRDFNVNERYRKTHQTALFIAAAKGNYHVCKVLLEYGASVHSLGRRTLTNSDHVLYPAEANKDNLPPVSILANTASLLYDAERNNNREKTITYFRICNLLIDWGADIAIWKDMSREDPMASYKESPSIFRRVLLADSLLALLLVRGGKKYLPSDFLARAVNIDNPTEKQITERLEGFESVYLRMCDTAFADEKYEADKPKRVIPAKTLRSCADLPFSEMCHEDCYRFLNRLALAESNDLIQPDIREEYLKILKGTEPPSVGDKIEDTDLHFSKFVVSSEKVPGEEQKLAKEKGLLPYQYKSGTSHPSRRLFSFMDKEKYPLEFDEQEHDRVVRRLKAHLENYFPGQVDAVMKEVKSGLLVPQTEKAVFTALYHGKISKVDRPPKVEEEQAKEAGNYPKFPLPFLMSEEEIAAEAGTTTTTTIATSDDKNLNAISGGKGDDVAALKKRIEELSKENELLKEENEKLKKKNAQSEGERALLMKQLYSGFQ